MSQQLSAYELIDRTPLTRHQKSLIGLVVMGNLAEFFDLFLIGFVVSLLTKPWHLTGLQTGTILACAGLGTVLGAVVWGALADRVGRRACFIWCTVTFVLFTVLCLFVPDGGWWQLALLRVGVGFGVGGLNITSIPYVQEFMPTRKRGLLAGLGSAFIPAGLFLGSLAQKAVGDNWQLLIALGGIPVFLLLWVRHVPESPRFYQLTGQEQKARESIAWALHLPPHAIGELPYAAPRPRSTYGLVFAEHKKSLAIISLGSFAFIMGGFAVQSWGQTLLHTAFDFSISTVATLFMLVSAADLLGRLLSAFLSDHIGRRATLFIFGLGGAVGCLMSAFHGGNGWVFFAGIIIIMMFGDGAFGVLNSFGAEQFPTRVRSTGLGLGYGIGASAKILGPFLMGLVIGGDFVKQNVTAAVITPTFIFFGACFALGALVYLLAQETKGRELTGY